MCRHTFASVQAGDSFPVAFDCYLDVHAIYWVLPYQLLKMEYAENVWNQWRILHMRRRCNKPGPHINKYHKMCVRNMRGPVFAFTPGQTMLKNATAWISRCLGCALNINKLIGIRKQWTQQVEWEHTQGNKLKSTTVICWSAVCLPFTTSEVVHINPTSFQGYKCFP
jgi:hypothetical protein